MLESQGKDEEAETMHRFLGLGTYTLTSVSHLGSVQWNQERIVESEGVEVRVMETRKKVLGNEHLDTLTAMANLVFTDKS